MSSNETTARAIDELAKREADAAVGGGALLRHAARLVREGRVDDARELLETSEARHSRAIEIVREGLGAFR